MSENENKKASKKQAQSPKVNQRGKKGKKNKNSFTQAIQPETLKSAQSDATEIDQPADSVIEVASNEEEAVRTPAEILESLRASQANSPKPTREPAAAPNKVPTQLKIAGSYPGVHIHQPGTGKISGSGSPSRADFDALEILPGSETNTSLEELNREIKASEDDIQNWVPQNEAGSASEPEDADQKPIEIGNISALADIGEATAAGAFNEPSTVEEKASLESDPRAESTALSVIANQPSAENPVAGSAPSPKTPIELPKSVPHLLRRTGTFAAATAPGDNSKPASGEANNSQSGRHNQTLTRIEFSAGLIHQQESIGSMQSPVEEMKKNINSQKDSVKFNFATVKELCRTHPLVSSIGAASAIFLLASCGALSQGLSKTFIHSGLAQIKAQHYQEAIPDFDRAIFLRQDSIDAYLDRGDCYFALGDFDKAFLDFNNVLRLSPRNSRALEKRAATNLELGKNEEAISDYLQLDGLPESEWKQSAESLTNLGAAYFALEEYGKALEQFNQCITLFPANVSAYLKRARCYEGLKQYDKAAQDYNQALKLEPNNVKALVNRARCFQSMHNFTDDLPYLNRALALQPRNAGANKYLGIHYARLQDPAKALPALDKAIGTNGSDAETYQERATLLADKGDVVKALTDLQSMAKLPGFDADAKYYLGMAKLHMASGNFAGAVNDFNHLITDDPDHKTEYLLKRAESFASLHDYKKALADCSLLLQEKPNDVQAAISHGRYSLLAGNKMTAVEDYCKALKLDPRNAEAYLARGNAYLQLKQASSAADDFKHALAIDPTSKAAKEKLAASISQMNQIAGSAVKPIATNQSKKPTVSKAALDEIATMDATTLMQKGYAALKKGDNDYALAALSRAVAQKPNDPNARQYLFYTLSANGDADAAVEQWSALEKLGVQDLESDLKCAQAISKCGNKSIGAGSWEHMITKYSNDAGALIRIARTCAASDYADKAIEACDKGLEHASDLTQIRELNTMRIRLSADGKPGSAPSAPATSGKYVGR